MNEWKFGEPQEGSKGKTTILRSGALYEFVWYELDENIF